MSNHATLSLRLLSPTREGQRPTFDFIVNGVSLSEALLVGIRDHIGRLVADTTTDNSHDLAVLSAEAPADFDGNRVLLFVCPECGDIGCGAITVSIVRKDREVIWSDFRYENDYDTSMTTRFENLGPFVFDADSYQLALSAARAGR